MALSDTITSLGTSIINLVNTRSKTDLSNITTAGENVIKGLASGIPTGTVIAYMGTTEPSGFLLMDGRVLSQETYADLYAVIGTSQLPSGATESGGVYTWTDGNGITYSTGAGTDDATHKYKMFAIADMTDGRYLMGSTVAGSRVVAGIPNITGSAGGTRYFAIAESNKTSSLSGVYSDATTGMDKNYEENGNNNFTCSLYFNASKSNSIYGKSSTVTPLSLKTKMLIRY